MSLRHPALVTVTVLTEPAPQAHRTCVRRGGESRQRRGAPAHRRAVTPHACRTAAQRRMVTLRAAAVAALAAEAVLVAAPNLAVLVRSCMYSDGPASLVRWSSAARQCLAFAFIAIKCTEVCPTASPRPPQSTPSALPKLTFVPRAAFRSAVCDGPRAGRHLNVRAAPLNRAPCRCERLVHRACRSGACCCATPPRDIRASSASSATACPPLQSPPLAAPLPAGPPAPLASPRPTRLIPPAASLPPSPPRGPPPPLPQARRPPPPGHCSRQQRQCSRRQCTGMTESGPVNAWADVGRAQRHL